MTATNNNMMATNGGMPLLCVILRVVYGAHASIDAVHVLCVLFPPCMQRCLGEPYTALAADLYTSLYEADADREHAGLRRVMAYWIAAMSLVRALAGLYAHTNTCLLLAVVVMYALEALAFEYEAFTAHAIAPRLGRAASLFSVGMAIATLFVLTR